MAGIVPVVSVHYDNYQIDAGNSRIGDEQTLSRSYAVRLADELVVDIDLKAAAYTGCLKVNGPFDLFGRKDHGGPVDTGLIVFRAR